VCKDARQGVRSADGLDTRMRCLDHRLAEMSGLLDGLAEGSGATLRAASDAVAQLEPTTECSDAKEIDPRPANPALRGEIDAAEATLARATALVSLGQFENAAPLADRAATVGEHAGSPGLMARALVIRAECEDRLGHFASSLATLQRAATAGAKAHDNTAIVDALSRYFLVDGDHLGHRGDALRTRPFIELALESAGQPAAERAAWLHYLAILLYDDSSKVDEAAADEREALAIRQRTLPPDHVYVLDSIETLGNIEAARGHFDEAKRMLEQVRDARVAARGPNDTAVSAVYSNLGALELRRGDLLAAVTYLELAVEIGDKVGNPDTPALFNLAITDLDLGRLAAAAKTFSRALAIYEQLSGPESLESSRDVAESSIFVGVVSIAQGDFARGRPMLLRGIEIARRSDSPSLASGLSHAARLALHDGDRARAHALVDEERKLPAPNPILRELVAAELARADTGCAAARASLAKVLADAVADDQGLLQAIATVELAECEVATGDVKGARTRLEAELARLEKAGADDSALAPARAVLARAR
jgi:tetratricopeptide (TPR) repeat protein